MSDLKGICKPWTSCEKESNNMTLNKRKTLFRKFQIYLGSLHTCSCNFIINFLPDDHLSQRIRSCLARTLGVKCGKKVLLSKGIFYSDINNIQIDENCQISHRVILDAVNKITIGKNVGIGYGTVIITGLHLGTNPNKRCEGNVGKAINIKDGVWIGANATIGPGVTLGAGCIVSAGSVVMRSMPAHTMVAGNPARVVKKLDEKV